METKYDVFISYSRKDLELVKKIKTEIDHLVGVDCWMDLNGIESGEQFEDVIINAICKCDTILFMMSVNSMQSEWALDELDFAKHEKKRIVLVSIDNAEMSGKFYFRYHKYDTITWSNQPQREKLIRDLKSWIGIGQKEKGEAGKVQTTENSAPAIQTYTLGNVSFDMIRVDGGTFMMGATSEQGNDAYDDERPAHQVTLSPYYIGETVVTQALWETVMGSNPSKFKGSNRPVETVSWDDCQEFILKLNQKTGRKFRLPTEAEWEFAARGGNKSQSYKYSGSNNIGDVACYRDNSNNQTHGVKSKLANELGLYDMSGNVWERCQDWYGDYPSSAQTNPLGPSNGSIRVYRGGCWDSEGGSCRVTSRGDWEPDYRWFHAPESQVRFLGLRLAL